MAKRPTGFWYCWKGQLDGLPARVKANNEREAKKIFKEWAGYEADRVEPEYEY